MGTVGWLLAYLGVLGILLGGAAFGVLAVLSPGVTGQNRVAAYGAPTRVRQPAMPETASEPDPQTYRIGPPVVYRGPEPPSQAEIAKLRLKAADREMRQAHGAHHHRARVVPPAAAETARSAASAPVPLERHSSNF